MTRNASRNAVPPPHGTAQIYPPPEQVFIDWLLQVPYGEDIRAAARQQVALIDIRMSRHPDVQCLRSMFVEMIEGDGRQPPAGISDKRSQRSPPRGAQYALFNANRRMFSSEGFASATVVAGDKTLQMNVIPALRVTMRWLCSY